MQQLSPWEIVVPSDSFVCLPLRDVESISTIGYNVRSNRAYSRVMRLKVDKEMSRKSSFTR